MSMTPFLKKAFSVYILKMFSIHYNTLYTAYLPLKQRLLVLKYYSGSI